MALHDNLKKIRTEKGLIKREVAKGVGITERTYISYEYGRTEPNMETLSKLADFYGVSTDYLLGREPAKEPTDPIEVLSSKLKLNLYERAIVTAYLAMDSKSRTDLVQMVQNVANAVKTGTESKKYTYTVQVAARDGEPPHQEQITQEERDRRSNLPLVPDDL